LQTFPFDRSSCDTPAQQAYKPETHVSLPFPPIPALTSPPLPFTHHNSSHNQVRLYSSNAVTRRLCLAQPSTQIPATITFFYVTRRPGRGDVGVDWTVTGPKTTHAPYWPRVAACLRKDTWQG